MRAPRRQLYAVPVTISEARTVEVRARDAAEARERVNAGHYERLGPKGERGFLLIGRPKAIEERSR